MRYVGTISYGIYVFHFMLPDLLPKLAALTGHPDALAPLGDRTLPFLAFYGSASIAIAPPRGTSSRRRSVV